MSRFARPAVTLWPWVMALLVCAPLLAPGYVLSYDMVWVPDIFLNRPDVWGLGSALPRAVPSDAVIGILGAVVPAALLQKAILVGMLGFAGMGMARLLKDIGGIGQLAGATLFVWNPFVAERLGLGQWPLLVAYAAVPWLIVTIRDRIGPAAVFSLAATALSPATGLMGLFIAMVGARRGMRLRVLAIGLAINAPWIAAGLLHGSAALSDEAAIGFFDVQPEAHLGRLGAVLSLGGVWNVDVVPASRTLWLATAFAVAIWVVIGVGLVSMWRNRRPQLVTLALVGAVGVLLALSGWLVTDLVAALANTVPGAGLIRDGTRYLMLLAPLEAVAFGMGAAAIAERLAAMQRRQWRQFAAVLLIILPVAAMPDLAWGLAGKLKPVDYPDSWYSAREGISYLPESGDIVVLPFTSYRQPDWNNDRPVLDPAGRFFDRLTVVNDELLVSGKPIVGEDRRAARIGESLRSQDVESALASDGIGVVVLETDAGDPGVTDKQFAQFGEVQLGTSGMRLFTVDDPVVTELSARKRAVMIFAWVLAGLTLVGAAIVALRNRLKR